MPSALPSSVAWLTVLVLVACKSTAAPDTDTDPPIDTDTDLEVEVALAPLHLTVQDPSSSYPQLDFQLLLLPLSDGGIALAASSGNARNISALDVVTTRPAPDTLHLEVQPGELSMPLVGSSQQLEWTAFSVTLSDTDADGAVDVGTGTMVGSAVVANSQEGFVFDFDAAVDASLDDQPGEFRFVLPSPLLPSDPLTLSLTEPALSGGSPTLSAGAAIPLALEPWRGDLIVGLTPQINRWLPWGTTLELDAVDLTDVAGHAFETPEAVTVVADPGDPRDNLGFENDVGWAVRNGALGGAPQGLTPTGERVAVLDDTATLVGEFRIFPGDTTISLDISAVADFWDSLTLIRVVQIAQDGTRTVSWTSSGDAGSACTTCGDYAWRLDVERVSVPLAAPADEGVMLVVETEINQYLGLPRARVAIDAVAIE